MCFLLNLKLAFYINVTAGETVFHLKGYTTVVIKIEVIRRISRLDKCSDGGDALLNFNHWRSKNMIFPFVNR